jgi:putative endonuclease
VQDLLRRHNQHSTPSTKNGIPWTLVYYEVFPTIAEETIREREIKNKKSRKYIEFLICEFPNKSINSIN